MFSCKADACSSLTQNNCKSFIRWVPMWQSCWTGSSQGRRWWWKIWKVQWSNSCHWSRHWCQCFCRNRRNRPIRLQWWWRRGWGRWSWVLNRRTQVYHFNLFWLAGSSFRHCLFHKRISERNRSSVLPWSSNDRAPVSIFVFSYIVHKKENTEI